MLCINLMALSAKCRSWRTATLWKRSNMPCTAGACNICLVILKYPELFGQRLNMRMILDTHIILKTKLIGATKFPHFRIEHGMFG